MRGTYERPGGTHAIHTEPDTDSMYGTRGSEKSLQRSAMAVMTMVHDMEKAMQSKPMPATPGMER